MNRNFVLSLVRHTATFLGGLLVAKGFADANEIETLISGIVTAAGIFWSLWHHTPEQLPKSTA